MKNQRGFTLVEILIVVMIIAILAVVALFIFNPAKSRHRVWDIERKRELEQLRILFENYFLENQHYPIDGQVCYDAAQIDVNGVCSCHICGLESDPGTFSSLVQLLYCDPEHGRKDYLYKYDCVNPEPLWYAGYTQLGTGPGAETGLACNYAVSNDPARIESSPEGCAVVTTGGGESGPTPTPGGGGGGPSPTPLPSCPSDPAPKFCFQGVICNNCGDFANCTSGGTCNSPLQLYSDGACSNSCQ